MKMIKILTQKRDLTSPKEQGADYVELFFDLVFVYAITKITGLTAHHLDGFHIFQSMIIFWLIWWGWTQFTWALNGANTKIARIRMGVLVATAVAFVLALATSEAFGDGVLWFAIPYIIVRLLGLGLAIQVIPKSEGKGAAIQFAVLSLSGLAAVFIGAMVSPEARIWWWLGAIALDMVASFFGDVSKVWKINPKHFAERHALIVIIALGESLIVAASAIDVQNISIDLIVVGGLAVLVTCLLWWSYFAWINEHIEEHFSKKPRNVMAKVARDSYSLMHFLLVCGIIGVAVSFEKIMAHPHDVLTLPIFYALCGGYIFFVGFTGAAVYRASKLILLPRLLILIASMIGIYFTIGSPTYYALSIIAFSLILLIFIEWKKCRLS